MPEETNQTLAEKVNLQLDAIIEPLKKDIIKFFDGEKLAPGKRIRAYASELSTLAKDLRRTVSEVKKERKLNKDEVAA